MAILNAGVSIRNELILTDLITFSAERIALVFFRQLILHRSQKDPSRQLKLSCQLPPQMLFVSLYLSFSWEQLFFIIFRMEKIRQPPTITSRIGNNPRPNTNRQRLRGARIGNNNRPD